MNMTEMEAALLERAKQAERERDEAQALAGAINIILGPYLRSFPAGWHMSAREGVQRLYDDYKILQRAFDKERSDRP